jgi:hypothetical protein
MLTLQWAAPIALTHIAANLTLLADFVAQKFQNFPLGVLQIFSA